MFLSSPSVWLNFILMSEPWWMYPKGSVIVTLVLNLETEEPVNKLVIPEPVTSVVSWFTLILLETKLWLDSIGFSIATFDSPNVSVSIGVNVNWVLGVSFTVILPFAVVEDRLFSSDEIMFESKLVAELKLNAWDPPKFSASNGKALPVHDSV